MPPPAPQAASVASRPPGVAAFSGQPPPPDLGLADPPLPHHTRPPAPPGLSTETPLRPVTTSREILGPGAAPGSEPSSPAGRGPGMWPHIAVAQGVSLPGSWGALQAADRPAAQPPANSPSGVVSLSQSQASTMRVKERCRHGSSRQAPDAARTGGAPPHPGPQPCPGWGGLCRQLRACPHRPQGDPEEGGRASGSEAPGTRGAAAQWPRLAQAVDRGRTAPHSPGPRPQTRPPPGRPVGAALATSLDLEKVSSSCKQSPRDRGPVSTPAAPPPGAHRGGGQGARPPRGPTRAELQLHGTRPTDLPPPRSTRAGRAPAAQRGKPRPRDGPACHSPLPPGTT